MKKKIKQPSGKLLVKLVEGRNGNFRFDEDGYEFWEHVTPRQLIETIESSSAKIEWDLHKSTGVVDVLARVKEAVSPARWQTVLKQLVPTCWLCIEGDDWDPLILDNGGVMVRNYHRARYLDLDHGASISGAQSRQIRAEVGTALRRGVSSEDSIALLLHHGKSGAVLTQKLPIRESFRGQSILFVVSGLLRQLPLLDAVAKRAHPAASGDFAMLGIRLFEDVACAYVFGRADDLCLSMSAISVGFYDLDEPKSLWIAKEGAARFELEKCVRTDLIDEFEYLKVPEVLQEDLLSLMISDEPHSMVSELFAMMNWFPPIFARNRLRPPGVASGSVLGSPGKRRSIYSFKRDVTTPQIKHVVGDLKIKGAKLGTQPGPKAGRSLKVPYQNLLESRKLAKALRRQLGPLQLTIPHLGLIHSEPARGSDVGNGRWFGFRSPERIIVAS